MKLNKHLFYTLPAVLLLTGCNSAQDKGGLISPMIQQPQAQMPRELSITPQSIPGVPRYANDGVTGGYAPSNVQAQLKIDVKEGTKEVKVIRDNNDPYVITKPYTLKNADP